MVPSGPVQTRAPWGDGSFGVNWENVTQYDDFIREAADPVGWPIERVRAHIMIETQGIPTAIQQNNANGWSYGLMQVVPYGVGWEGWHQLVKEKAGLPANAPEQKVRQALSDPRINILVGVAILETFYQNCGNLDGASSSFFTGTCNWWGNDPISRVTGATYKATIDALIAEQKAAEGAMEMGAGVDDDKPEVAADPLGIVFGGNSTPVTFGHLAMHTLDLYHYGVGHGTTSPFMHPGLDIGVPYNTPLHSPAAGEVVCVGGNGTPMWGQGCGAFRDTGDLGPDGANLGVGNISILLDTGHKLTLGHSRQAFVNPGDRVVAGQQVGTSGGMFGAHTHIDVATCRPDLTGDQVSCYWLNEPVSALLEAMGGNGVVLQPRIPVPQPQEWDVFVPVTATRDGVPVLQWANLEAPPVATALVKGEVFEAVMLVLGNDMNWYWVSRLGSRIPIEGTAAPGGPQIATA